MVFIELQTVEEDNTGELPQETTAIAKRFPKLPYEEMGRIFQNRLKPANLYKLRHMMAREGAEN